jgi:hypothetical protein
MGSATTTEQRVQHELKPTRLLLVLELQPDTAARTERQRRRRRGAACRLGISLAVTLQLGRPCRPEGPKGRRRMQQQRAWSAARQRSQERPDARTWRAGVRLHGLAGATGVLYGRSSPRQTAQATVAGQAQHRGGKKTQALFAATASRERV